VHFFGEKNLDVIKMHSKTIKILKKSVLVFGGLYTLVAKVTIIC